MNEGRSRYDEADGATRRWWFFVALLALVLCPPFAAKNWDLNECYEMVNTTFEHALFFVCEPAFPVFQIIAIGVFALLIILRNKARAVFALHAGVSYVLCAVLQNIAVTPRYGLSAVSSNVVMFALVAVAWFLEAATGRNDVSARSRPVWKYAVIPPALFAFWLPLEWATFGPDVRLAKLVTSGSALTFCMMTPAYLAVLIFFHPRVNLVTLRVTSAAGVIIGLFATPMLFGYGSRWNGILHLPLLVLSVVGLILSMRSVGVGEGGVRALGVERRMPV